MALDENVNLIVSGKSPVAVPWSAALNIHTALEAVYDIVRDHSQFSFGLQFLGTYQQEPERTLGYALVMLNGVQDDPDGQMYWAVLVNGKYDRAGIDNTFPLPGDQVAIVYEPYSAAKHGKTAVEVKHRAYQASLPKHA